jgi:DNA-binding transcriptional ArsR family regulator
MSDAAITSGASEASTINIHWDIGTAYELLISLHVLHQPDTFGVRASWAAGIRSRIPAAERKFLEDIMPYFSVPFCWVYEELPAPKDAINLLWTLRSIPRAERMSKMMCLTRWEMPEAQLLTQVAEKRAYDQADFDRLSGRFCKDDKPGHGPEEFRRFLAWWVRPEETGEMLFNAFQAYYQAFFEEEEKRVAPVLQDGLRHAQELATHLSLPDLIAELSQGVHLELKPTLEEITIIPAYWTTPLVMWDDLSERNMLLFFGARPTSMSAIPGEIVPDGLVHTLKALADPTRLKILHYLAHEELTPSELARRLHLRAPTLTHHLSELRLAGLVNLRMHGQEKLYATRREALGSTFENLERFLDNR